MYQVMLFGLQSTRRILTRTYRTAGMAQRVARSWARWGVLHCGSAHGKSRGSGYIRWSYRDWTVYDEENGVRRAKIKALAPKSTGAGDADYHASFASYLE